MTDIKPFKALVYNPQKIKDLSRVVCPPYDVISEKERNELYNRDDFNFIKILLPQEKITNNKSIDKYKNSKLTFLAWQDELTLVDDKKEAIYFYLQDFLHKGERKSRLGFISLMRLQSAGKISIHPHEATRKEPKDDRYALLKSVKANLSPIFTIFSDQERQISRIFDNYLVKKEPMLQLVDNHQGAHKIWRLEEPMLIRRLKDYMRNKSVVIADGHHRYEVACEFRDRLLKRYGDERKAKQADFNYIMTYFMDLHCRGLTVLPIHRLVKKIPKNALERLDKFFQIEKVADQFDLFFLLKKTGPVEHAFGLYLDNEFYLLRLKSEHSLQAPDADERSYNNLDVVLLHKIIFEKILSLDASQIEFIKEEDEAIELVNNATYMAVFFLCPTRVEQIEAIALANRRMPPKSTYFYPKLLSGLVMHKF
jgi:uncharacterized protein (DUF1015 family)